MNIKTPLLILILAVAAHSHAQADATEVWQELELLPPYKERTLRSRNGADAVQISVKNLRQSKIGAFWLDYSGRRKKYADIESGQSWTQSTFATHPWLFLDASGKAIGIIVAGKTPGWLELK